MAFMFNFRQKLKEGKPLIGTLQAMNSPEVTEMLTAAGFDWLWIDLEHSTIDVEGAQRILQAAGSNCPCVLRVPCGDQVWTKKILDIGAAGVIIPGIKSAREAAEIVQFCRYPPQGTRSIGLSRAHGYGMWFDEYVATANQNVAVIMQIEHIAAVKDIDAIVKIQGIDALIIGPYDLSGTMGKTGQVRDPEVQAQVERVRQVCLDTGMPVGIFTTNPEEVKPLIEKGYTVIAVGIDTIFLGRALQQALKIIKE
jgi:2-keto-3-deoxy-L-rhamnonate aldolase RhmA